MCGPSIRLFCLQLLAWGSSVWDRPWSEGTKPGEGCRVLQGWFNNSTLHTKAILVVTLVGDACLPWPVIVSEKGCGNNWWTQPVNDCGWDMNSGHPEAKSSCWNPLICQILFHRMVFFKVLWRTLDSSKGQKGQKRKGQGSWPVLVVMSRFPELMFGHDCLTLVSLS